MSKNTNTRIQEVLLIEDSPSLAVVYQGYMNGGEYQVSSVSNGSEALAALEKSVPDVVLLDLHLPDMSGMAILKTIHEHGWNCSVIIITAHGSVETAVEAMRYGAVDFVAKPFDATRLRVTLDNVVEKRQLSNMVDHYRKTFDRERFHSFIGNSLPMQAVFRIIESAASSRATVFVTGESGTGKELTAEALHLESQRSDKPFVAINCAAIPRDLMESEIFGHLKGAFTGAVSNRDGAATRADGGTLFLDEICELDLDLQSKLLRFIQTGTFQRVGDSKEQKVDVRFVCATNRDPLSEVKAGRFREDLYYRLNVIPVHLPPLNERDNDILLIANEMLLRIAREESKSFCRLSNEVSNIFKQYAWPGNVRELENTIRNIVVLNNGDVVSQQMLPPQLLDGISLSENMNLLTDNDSLSSDDYLETDIVESIHMPGAINDQSALADLGSDMIRPLWLEEKDIIKRAIRLCDDNVPKAAAFLGISASTIYRKLQAWERKPA